MITRIGLGDNIPDFSKFTEKEINKMTMKTYIGTKIINAKPMTHCEWCTYLGLTVPENENGEGYLVEYTNGGKPNTLEYAGYVSWSPKDVFERAYGLCDNMTFGLAIASLKLGKKVAKKGWKDGLSIFIDDLDSDSPRIKMKTFNSEISLWFPTTSHLLAEDWVIVP